MAAMVAGTAHTARPHVRSRVPSHRRPTCPRRDPVPLHFIVEGHEAYSMPNAPPALQRLALCIARFQPQRSRWKRAISQPRHSVAQTRTSDVVSLVQIPRLSDAFPRRGTPYILRSSGTFATTRAFHRCRLQRMYCRRASLGPISRLELGDPSWLTLFGVNHGHTCTRSQIGIGRAATNHEPVAAEWDWARV